MAKSKQDINDNNAIIPGGTGYISEVIIKQAGKTVLYPVTKSELQAIKSSNYGDTALNACIATATAFISFLIALITCEFETEYIKLAFLFATIIFAAISIVAFIFWTLLHRKSNELYNEIINREDAVTLK